MIPVPEPTTVTKMIATRVINNAMTGGNEPIAIERRTDLTPIYRRSMRSSMSWQVRDDVAKASPHAASVIGQDWNRSASRRISESSALAGDSFSGDSFDHR